MMLTQTQTTDAALDIHHAIVARTRSDSPRFNIGRRLLPSVRAALLPGAGHWLRYDALGAVHRLQIDCSSYGRGRHA